MREMVSVYTSFTAWYSASPGEVTVIRHPQRVNHSRTHHFVCLDLRVHLARRYQLKHAAVRQNLTWLQSLTRATEEQQCDISQSQRYPIQRHLLLFL